MKRPIRMELKDNTLRKTVVSLPALNSTVLQDRLLDVDMSTKEWDSIYKEPGISERWRISEYT